MKLTDIFSRAKNALHVNMGYEKDALGNEYWYHRRKLHRDDGPAYIGANGEKQWYKFGKKHRDGGLPAVEGALGGREWWVDDRRHRPDGPAIERPDGKNEWYLDGKPWPQGRVETPIIQQEQKAQALAEAVQGATVADEQIKLLQPLKFKKPVPGPGQQ